MKNSVDKFDLVQVSIIKKETRFPASLYINISHQDLFHNQIT